jgi:hypothetical protein
MEINHQFLCRGPVLALAFCAIALGENEVPREPTEPVRTTIDVDGEPRELSDAAKKTLGILKAEKIESITLTRVEPEKTFEALKAFLAKHKVTIRLKHYGPRQEYEPAEPIGLRNIPVDKFMGYFDQFVGWGWIIYPDGSITYFDNQCGCCWPKNFGCHESQYEAGKPEVMAKEQKTETEKPRAEHAVGGNGG